MKKRYILIAIAISLCLSISANSEAANRKRGNFRKKEIPEALKKFDLNNDGKITIEERKAFLEMQRSKTPLESSDNNNDGKLDKFERIMARDKKIKEMDKDGDGKISPEERKAGMEARKAIQEKKKQERIAKFDTDGDGVLSDAEKSVARQNSLNSLKANNPEAYQKLITKFDKNGDGTLDTTELKPNSKKFMPRPDGPNLGISDSGNQNRFNRNLPAGENGKFRIQGSRQKFENKEKTPFPRNPGLFPRKSEGSPYGGKEKPGSTSSDGGFLDGVNEVSKPAENESSTPSSNVVETQERVMTESDEQMTNEEEKLLELLDF